MPKGVILDLLVGGQEVDVKSTTGGSFGWMIPPEAIGQLCVLLRVNESASNCAVGLVRARPEYLRPGANRDAKTGLSAGGRRNIWWLALDFPYTPNFWSMISDADREQIMGAGGGTARLARLFELCVGVPVSRVVIASVAAQDDFMKRIRRNSGARDVLAPKGIAILYSENDRDLMLKLGVTVGSRQFVSYRPKNSEEEMLLRAANHID